MSAPKLLIRKRMLQIQGRVRPTCFVQAIVAPTVQSSLETFFSNETLFRRAAYSASWPAGTLPVPPSLAPALAALLKNDACPEITVKTLLAGQLYQGTSAWDMMTFELIAKVAFDNLVQLVRSIMELDRDVFYLGSQAEAEALATDAAVEATGQDCAPREAA